MDSIITREQSAALDNLKIKAINPMQESAIVHCRRGGSMILLSPTGTGKTLAYLLPLLERIDECRARDVQAMVIVPTRELAKQVNEVWRGMKVPHQMVALYGGRPVEQEAAMFAGASPVVVVGTPGRLIDHIKKGTFAVDACLLVVIDEFDKCLEMGFRDEMESLLALLPAVQARYLLSATDAPEIPLFAGTAYGKPLDFRADGAQPLARTSFYSVTTTPDERLQTLFRLLCSFNGEPAIVFCNFRESVDEVRAFLTKNGLRCAAYHGAMEQKDRELALYRFTASCTNILVSTDIAARGLDIKDVIMRQPGTNSILITLCVSENSICVCSCPTAPGTWHFRSKTVPMSEITAPYRLQSCPIWNACLKSRATKDSVKPPKRAFPSSKTCSAPLTGRGSLKMWN